MFVLGPPSKFDDMVQSMRRVLLDAPVLDTGEWQAIQGAPQGRMVEVEDVSLEMPIPLGMDELQIRVKPNLPWAEDHFRERVSGVPHNPPPSHEYWPFAQRSNEEHTKDDGRFSHTYPERFWPRMANVGGKTNEGRQVWVPHRGIRFEYGDLADLIELIRDRPSTRQAYLPVWFPEDLRASRQGERVPCTLGYHFMVRNDRLSCRYYIRSCDFVRHFRDDVYMAARLTQWIAAEVNQEWVEAAGGRHEGARQLLAPGKLVMHISSLHAFAADRQLISKELEEDQINRLTNGGWW